MTFNHAYDIAFTVTGSVHPTGDDVTGKQIREALIKRAKSMSDDELIEAVGHPYDTYEEE